MLPTLSRVINEPATILDILSFILRQARKRTIDDEIMNPCWPFSIFINKREGVVVGVGVSIPTLRVN